MKIYFDGCSVCWGGELKSSDPKFNEEGERYSKLVCDALGAHESNMSRQGASNFRVARQCLVRYNMKDYDLAVIQLTYNSRNEYWDPGKNKFHQFRVNYLDRMDGKGELINRFYKDIYDPFYGDMYEYMFATAIRDHCKVMGIPLVLLTVGVSENQNKFAQLRTRNMNKKIDWDIDIAELLTKEDRAPFGHPNQKGHQKIADKILEIVN